MDAAFHQSALILFIPTFFVVSITPGMCMTLAMTLGMTLGVRTTLWMMAGELVGVGLVAAAAVIGVAAVMLARPELFFVLKTLGCFYLIFLGIQLWQSKGRLALNADTTPTVSPRPWQLASQGFITAVANPKGWAFFIALLPPFIDPQRSLISQLPMLVIAILLIEWFCLMLYAAGGASLRLYLLKSAHVRQVNRLSGTLMVCIGLWLVMS